MKIIHQGAVIVNDEIMVYQNDRVVCLEIDLHSKYAGVTTGVASYKGRDLVPVLYFYANESALKLDDQYDRDVPTHVEFPEYEGWDIFACQGPGRYTTRLVLMKRDAVAS